MRALRASLGGRALLLGSANAFDYAMQFLLPVVLVRSLDAATFGEYRLLWLAIGTVMAIAPLGIPQGLFYFMPRADAATRRLYAHQTLLYLGCAGLVAAWAVSPWNPLLPAALEPLSAYGPLVPAFMLLWGTAAMLDLLPSAEERVGWQAAASIGLSLLRAVTLAVGALATGSMHVLMGLLVALALVKLAVLFGYVARYHGLGGRWLDRASFADQFRHCAPFGLSGSLYGLRSQADQWVAASLFALHSFAAFSIAAVLGPLVNLFRISISNAFLPSMSRLQAAGDVRALLEMNGRANVLAATFLCPLLAFAFAFAGEVVSVVYTAAYLEAAPVMRVYVVGLAAGLVEIGSLLLLLRQGGYALGVNALALLLSIALSWQAAGTFGLTGAAAGSVVAIWFDRCVNLRRIARRTGMPFRRLQDWPALGGRIASAGIAAGFAWIVVEQLLAEAAPVARLALGGACLAAVYAALQLGTRSGREAMLALRNLGNHRA